MGVDIDDVVGRVIEVAVIIAGIVEGFVDIAEAAVHTEVDDRGAGPLAVVGGVVGITVAKVSVIGGAGIGAAFAIIVIVLFRRGIVGVLVAPGIILLFFLKPYRFPAS